MDDNKQDGQPEQPNVAAAPPPPPPPPPATESPLAAETQPLSEEGNTSAAAAAPKKSRKKLAIFVLILLILTAVGLVFGLGLLDGEDSPAMRPESSLPIEPAAPEISDPVMPAEPMAGPIDIAPEATPDFPAEIAQNPQDEALVAYVEQIRAMANLPVETPQGVTWTAVRADLEANEVFYRYQVERMSAEQYAEIAQEERDAMTEQMKTQIFQIMCQYPDVKEMLSQGVGYRWHYYDVAGSLLTEFTLTQGGCAAYQQGETDGQ